MPNFEIGNFNAYDDKTEKSKSESSGKKSSKLKTLLKKKPFLIAVFVVSLLGLYAWYRKSITQTESGGGLVLSGGYPTVGGTYTSDSYSDNNTAYTSDIYDSIQNAFASEYESLQNSFEQQMSQMQQSYDTTTDNLTSQVSTLSDRLNTSEDIITTQSSYITMLQDIEQMKANSDSYHYATTQAQKDALHQANQSIADKWGWTFSNGYWYDSSGQNIYVTPTQQSISGSPDNTVVNKTASSGSFSYNTTSGTVTEYTGGGGSSLINRPNSDGSYTVQAGTGVASSSSSNLPNIEGNYTVSSGGSSSSSSSSSSSGGVQTTYKMVNGFRTKVVVT